MQVQQIMTGRVIHALAGTPIHEIATRMCINRISGMPVVDDDRRIVGIISEKDILHRMFPDVSEWMESAPLDFEALESQYRDVMGLTAGDLMTRVVATVTPDMPVLKAAAMMWLRKIRRIPVADANGCLCGIISIGDVHRAIFESNLESRQRTRTTATG